MYTYHFQKDKAPYNQEEGDESSHMCLNEVVEILLYLHKTLRGQQIFLHVQSPFLNVMTVKHTTHFPFRELAKAQHRNPDFVI